MARAKSPKTIVSPHDMTTIFGHMRRNATYRNTGKGRVVGNLEYNAGHDARRIARTPHGPGGIKPHQLRVPKVRTPKSGIKIVHNPGLVKIPSSLGHPRPSKGMHNHLKKVI